MTWGPTLARDRFIDDDTSGPCTVHKRGESAFALASREPPVCGQINDLAPMTVSSGVQRVDGLRIPRKRLVHFTRADLTVPSWTFPAREFRGLRAGPEGLGLTTWKILSLIGCRSRTCPKTAGFHQRCDHTVSLTSFHVGSVQ